MGKLEIQQLAGISMLENRHRLSDSDKKELLFWSTDPLEGPNGELFDNIIHKADFIKAFNHFMPRLGLTGGESVLELGCGHGWASALVKRAYPSCYMVASDLSLDAVRFIEKYETMLRVLVDEKWSFSSCFIPFDREQFDVIFTFAAFHHFVEDNDYSAPLREMLRVLKPTGKIVLLYEPCSSKWMYRRAIKQAQGSRTGQGHEVDEQVLIMSEMKRVCKQLDCQLNIEYCSTSFSQRGWVESHYQALRQRFQRFLYGGVNLTIKNCKEEQPTLSLEEK